jgi:putative FmdB family regulatory protein
MPLYEYECRACGKRTELLLRRFDDPPLAACPECGGPVKKLISSPAFQFKGSGWYVTDYAKGHSPSKSEGKESDAKASESKPSESKSDGKGSGGETKTESKPATTTSTKNES